MGSYSRMSDRWTWQLYHRILRTWKRAVLAAPLPCRLPAVYAYQGSSVSFDQVNYRVFTVFGFVSLTKYEVWGFEAL